MLITSLISEQHRGDLTDVIYKRKVGILVGTGKFWDTLSYAFCLLAIAIARGLESDSYLRLLALPFICILRLLLYQHQCTYRRCWVSLLATFIIAGVILLREKQTGLLFVVI